MKEHGLLLSAPMVVALGAGLKTQTRRAITMHNSVIEKFSGWTKAQVWEMLDFSRAKVNAEGRLYVPFKAGVTTLKMAIEVKPRIEVGDVIWWKETWQRAGWNLGGRVQAVKYVADGTLSDWINTGRKEYDADLSKKQPSMFMPRWAARYTSKVVGARPEFLQEISEADALAEGVSGETDITIKPNRKALVGIGYSGPARTARNAYRRLWENINGPGTWDANPLVWVFEFEKPVVR